jgi:hypothetical protein
MIQQTAPNMVSFLLRGVDFTFESPAAPEACIARMEHVTTVLNMRYTYTTILKTALVQAEPLGDQGYDFIFWHTINNIRVEFKGTLKPLAGGGTQITVNARPNRDRWVFIVLFVLFSLGLIAIGLLPLLLLPGILLAIAIVNLAAVCRFAPQSLYGLLNIEDMHILRISQVHEADRLLEPAPNPTILIEQVRRNPLTILRRGVEFQFEAAATPEVCLAHLKSVVDFLYPPGDHKGKTLKLLSHPTVSDDYEFVLWYWIDERWVQFEGRLKPLVGGTTRVMATARARSFDYLSIFIGVCGLLLGAMGIFAPLYWFLLAPLGAVGIIMLMRITTCTFAPHVLHALLSFDDTRKPHARLESADAESAFEPSPPQKQKS